MQRPILVLTPAALALAALAVPAHAQCDPISFESGSIGQVATSFVPGVTVTALPGTCGGAGSVLPIIVAPFGGSSSGTRAIGIQTGCPDFSDDYLRLEFAALQDEVSFNFGSESGLAGADFQITAYNGAGTVIFDEPFETAGGINTFVRLNGIGQIWRVDVRSLIGLFEVIDDLQFATDDTPPEVQIDAPTFDSCFCDDAVVSVLGSVDDPDGDYECDRLSYRALAPGSPWNFLGDACGAFSGTLHTWSTSGMPEGRYYLRVTGRNACGLTTSDVTVVRIDRSYGTLSVTEPADGATVCGVVDIKGTINDSCGIGSWTVESGPVGGPFTTLATGSSKVIACTIAEWDTRGLADGSYELRVNASDDCGHAAAERVIPVEVDNASGLCGCLTDLDGDGITGFTDLTALLGRWGPCSN